MNTPWYEHIRVIAQWQAENNSNDKPPVYYNKRTDNWMRYAVKAYRDKVKANPLLAKNPPPQIQALIDLGLGYMFEETDKHHQQVGDDHALAGARGFRECAELILQMAEKGTFPSLYALTLRERHLACWLVTIQIGMLGDNKVGVTEESQGWALVERVIASVAQVQSLRQRASQWVYFCYALDHALSRSGLKADVWRKYVTTPSPGFFLSLYPGLNRARVAIEGGPGARLPRVPSPVEMIRSLNYVCVYNSRPVSFRDDRETTLRFEQSLVDAGFKIATVVRSGLGKHTGQYASLTTQFDYFLPIHRGKGHFGYDTLLDD